MDQSGPFTQWPCLSLEPQLHGQNSAPTASDIEESCLSVCQWLLGKRKGVSNDFRCAITLKCLARFLLQCYTVGHWECMLTFTWSVQNYVQIKYRVVLRSILILFYCLLHSQLHYITYLLAWRLTLNCSVALLFATYFSLRRPSLKSFVVTRGTRGVALPI